jgi:hypothetical protein
MDGYGDDIIAHFLSSVLESVHLWIISDPKNNYHVYNFKKKERVQK